MVASDFALYGLGAGARRVPFLRRYADHRVRRFSDTLKRNVFGLVALCRVVPGIVFVAFVACGWARVSLFRFTVASLVVSALYLPLTLYLVITFGVALDEYLGLWAWPLLLGAMAAAGFVRKRVFAFGDGREAADDVPSAPPVSGHRGMPALADGIAGAWRAAERIPPGLFYLPLVLTWAGLGIRHRSLTLPTTANPYIATGGMWGESKSAYFDDVAHRAARSRSRPMPCSSAGAAAPARRPIATPPCSCWLRPGSRFRSSPSPISDGTAMACAG